MQLFLESEGLLRVRFQSRHISSKSYLVWIEYDSDHIKAWYCSMGGGGAHDLLVRVLMLQLYCGTLVKPGIFKLMHMV